MNQVIHLLNQKNHFLEKFYTLNETELLNFSKGNFDNMDHFYQSREKLLELIKIIDNQIEASSANIDGDLSSEFKIKMREAMAVKDEYVNRILAQDLEILACIESAKSNIIRELQELKRVKKVVGSYRSKNPGPSFSEEA